MNFNFNKYIIYIENGSFIEKIKNIKKFQSPNIEIYENYSDERYINSKNKLGYFMYGVISKYEGKCIFIFVNDGIEKTVSKLSKLLVKSEYLSIDINESYSSFYRQINKINGDLIDKMFCYDYPHIMLDKKYYKVEMFMANSNSLWVKKLFYELKFLSMYFTNKDDEFNFIINFLNYKYLQHYCQLL
jgi:hypothetical protein